MWDKTTHSIRSNASTIPGYDRLTRTFHWMSVVGVVVAFTSAWTVDSFDETSHDWLLLAHKTAGVTVLWLTLVRLLWRRFARPIGELETSRPQRQVARGVHIALYGLMLLQPLLGWAYLSTRGRPLGYFGITLPSLLGRDADLADTFLSLHTAAADMILVLIGTHAAAAIVHHWLLRDPTLLRMLRGSVALRRPAASQRSAARFIKDRAARFSTLLRPTYSSVRASALTAPKSLMARSMRFLPSAHVFKKPASGSVSARARR
nr:cytochrome b [uncultured Rhodopila sp.]